MSHYKKGQLIWAKIKGYPWWPGVVAKANVDKHGNLKKDVVVNFIGENSHATLPQDKVADFVEKRKQHSVNKNKKLQESIQIAEKILDGTITYEQERNRLEELEEDDSSEDDGSSDDGSENQENELASSSRSHSPSSKKSDAISTSEALWKDSDSILNAKDRKDSVDKNSIDLDRSIDKSPSIDSDLEKPTKAEKKKKKEKEENKDKPQKLKKKDSLPQQKKLSKASSLQEPKKSKNTNPEKSRKPSVQKSAKDATPIKSRKIKGKLLIDEDGEVENFWKSPQNLATKPNKASHSESENLVKMVEEPQSAVLEKPELIKSKSVPDAKPAAIMEEEKEYQINEESDGEKEEEKLSKKKLKLENRSVDIPNPIVNEEPVIPHEQQMRENILKKFENDLEKLLRQLSAKLKESIKLEENDSDLLNLLEVMEEFEAKQLRGAELVNSKIGKIFKTIHYILIRYKPQLPENCDIIITAVAKILHIIKNRIMKFSLDNSEYLNILKIIPESEQQMMEFSMVNLLDLNFEKIRMKVEENEKAEAQVPFSLVAKAPIPEISKIEEEEEERIELPFKEDVLLALPSQQHAVTADILSDIKNIPQNPKEDVIEDAPNDGLASIPLRKKVCKKIAKLLQKCYLLEKNSAQELTIQIEDKLNRFNNGKENEYKQTIKVLHKLMKARKLRLDELNNLDDNYINNILKLQIHQVTKKI